MPFVNGVYKRLQSWVARQAAGAPISAVEFDADGNDEALALSLALLRDGSSLPTADMPWNGKGITGLRQAVAAGEPMEFAQANAAIQAGQTAANRLHNSGFTVNQRGVSGTVNLGANAYGHDRWKAGASGCSYTFAINGADVAITINSGSLLQIVHPADVSGGAYTQSQDSAGTALARIYQGSPAGAYATCPVSVTSMAAGTALVVEFGPGTVIRPQLVGGATAQAYNRKSVATELESCVAFFEVVSLNVTLPAAGPNGGGVGTTAPFHPKVAAPSVTSALAASGSSSGGVVISGITRNSFAAGIQNTGGGPSFISGTALVSADL